MVGVTRFGLKKCSVKGTFLGTDSSEWAWTSWGRLRDQMFTRQNVRGVGVDGSGGKRSWGAVLWVLEREKTSVLWFPGKNLGARIS